MREVLNLEEISIDVETVTPLFIAGADQRNIENEGLRAPSLRGLLRWWFRAIMGGMTAVSDLKELESKIFGSTEMGSNVRILSLTEEKPSLMKVERRRDPRTNRSKSFLVLEREGASNMEYDLTMGLGYLWFSIPMQIKQGQRIKCYPPKTKFKIVLSSCDENSLKIALGCLWSLIYLGGIGARMRRGAGSLKVNEVSGKTPYEFVFDKKSVNEAKEFIESNLVKISKDFKKYADRKFNPQKNPKFAVLSHAKVSLIDRPFDDWESTLEMISEVYQQFRRRKKLSHRYTFGLPIITHSQFRTLRQASPLLIGVMDLNGSYTARIVKFYTSIHHNFSEQLEFLKRDLDGFNNAVTENKNLCEIKIKIPEVK